MQRRSQRSLPFELNNDDAVRWKMHTVENSTALTFVPDPFIIDDQMIGNEQLIMTIIEQQSILNFRFSNTEFLQVTTFQFSLSLSVTNLFTSLYLTDFLNGVEINDIRSFFARLRKEIFR